MKKILSIIIAIIIIICIFSLPSFALNFGSFSYEVVNDEVVITKYIGTNRTSITVPATIKEMPVVAISEGAFKGNTELELVKVSEGIKDIGASVFENCTSLATITLPTTIIHIGEKAIYNTAYYNTESNWKKPSTESSTGDIGFGNGMGQITWEDIAAKGLEYLYLGQNLIEISFSGTYAVKSDTLVIADGAFAGCDAEKVNLPSTLISIGNNAFKNCEKLKEVVFPDSIENIGDSAFEGCISLKKIELPDKYIEMSSSAMYNTGFYNNEENWNDNALYLGNTLIDIRENYDVVEVKSGTEYIIGNSLRGNDVVIPQSVTKISDDAFVSIENTRIFGYTDTVAQEFANEKNIIFIALDKVLKGDVDFNGILDREDYNILVKVSSLQTIQTYPVSLIGDMDDDGSIDGIDVIILDLMLNDMPPSRLKGDVNGDNKVDVADYDLLVKLVSTNERVTDNVMFQRADINEDGAVDGFDAINLDLALNEILTLI